jgi:hypothetical protein
MSFAEADVPPTQPVSLRLPPDVLAWLKARGEAEDRSPAYLVAKLVRAEMTREAKAKARPKSAR